MTDMKGGTAPEEGDVDFVMEAADVKNNGAIDRTELRASIGHWKDLMKQQRAKSSACALL